MSKVFVTHTSVGIDAGSSMRFRTYDKDLVEFRASDLGGEFDISFEVEALREFLELGGRAVAEADALRARKQAKADPKHTEAKEAAA
jgi:hypothetical protein